MKRSAAIHHWRLARAGFIPTLIVAASLVFGVAPALADNDHHDSRDKEDHHPCDRVEVVRPNERYHGKTYGEWSAKWWQWVMEHPMDGHPNVDSPDFDVRSGQRGNVWFLAAPFGTVERTVTIPRNKALFIALLNAEASTLEGPPFYGANEREQRFWAKWNADHIVRDSLFFEVNDQSLSHITSFRAVSPQFRFNAPTPWIFGSTGGRGTAVGAGYYVLLEPLPKGEYTIHYGGELKYSIAGGDGFDYEDYIDITYHVIVE